MFRVLLIAFGVLIAVGGYGLAQWATAPLSGVYPEIMMTWRVWTKPMDDEPPLRVLAGIGWASCAIGSAIAAFGLTLRPRCSSSDTP